MDFGKSNERRMEETDEPAGDESRPTMDEALSEEVPTEGDEGDAEHEEEPAETTQVTAAPADPPERPEKPDRMPDEPESFTAEEASEGMTLMDPVPEEPTESAVSGDQVPREAGSPEATAGDDGGRGYVRLRFRAEDEQLELLDASRVEGELLTPTEIDSDLVYEVRRGNEMIRTEGVTGSGERHTYMPEELGGGHRVAELPYVEFTVRIPSETVSTETLAESTFALYRVKERTGGIPSGDTPMAERFEREVREIARLDGLDMDSLAPAVHEQLRSALASPDEQEE